MSDVELTRRGALRAALAAGGALVLPGCAAGGLGSGPASGPSLGAAAENYLRRQGEKLGVPSISLLAYSAPQAEAIHQLAPRFTDLTGIAVNWTALDEQSAANKAAVSLGSGSASYDVVHLTSDLLPTYASRGWLADLDRLRRAGTVPGWGTSAYGRATTDLLRWKDTLYAAPMFLGTQLFYYRTDVFRRYGIGTPPRTFAELREVCAKVHGTQLSAIALRSAPSPSQLLFVWSAWLYAFGGSYYRRYADGSYSGVALDSPAAVRSLQLYGTLLRQYAPTGATNWSVEDVTRAFTTGRVAMVQDGAVFGGTFNDPKSSQVAGKVGTFVIPSGTAGRFVPYNCHGWGVARTSTRAAAAWLFVQWATVQATLTAAAAGPVGFSTPPIATIYTSRSYAKKYGFDDFVPSVTRTISVAEDGNVSPLRGDPNYLPGTTDWSTVGQQVSEQLSRAVTGQTSAAAAVRAAAAVVSGR